MKVFLSLLFIFSLFSSYAFEFTVFHTNDLHSSFEGESFGSLGHYARLSTVIKSSRSKVAHSSSILVDAGDFYSGSLIHALAVQAEVPYFPEYEFFDSLQYDGVTLGNHEFDGGEDGLNIMLSKVIKVGARVPIISTNLKVLRKPIVRSKVVRLKNRNGEKLVVGLLGALGPDGCSVSKGNRQASKFHGYDDVKTSSRWNSLFQVLNEEVKKLKSSGVDIIVLLLHGGGDEDSKIARKVPLINIIIAGHTHEVYFKKTNETFISQAGSNGKQLGVLNFSYNKILKKLTLISQEKIAIDENVDLDKDVSRRVNFYSRTVEQLIQKRSNFLINFNDVIFSPESSLDRGSDIHNALGKEITTSIAKRIRKEKPDFKVYFTSLGLIRAGLKKGFQYKLKDIFKILPIGFHDKFSPGAQALSFYISAKELMRLVQFLELYSRFRPTFTPAFSNSLSFKVSRFGIPFINRIKELKINGLKPTKEDLIHVGTNSFVFKYINFLKKKSFGIVEVIPKDKNGKKLKDPYGYYPEYLEYALSKMD